MSRILYYHQQSNFSRKIRILLAEKNLYCEFKEVDLRNKPPEFLKISPIGRVPVFIEEDGTVIWDLSSANMKRAKLEEFRQAAYDYLGRAHDVTFELTDAILQQFSF